MRKLCKKCGKEIPQNSKKDTCENCQSKTFGTVRKIGEGALMVVVVVGTAALAIITKGKLGGGPKA